MTDSPAASGPAERLIMLCHFCAIDLTPPEFVDLTAKAGFNAVSLMLKFPRTYPKAFPVLGDTPMRRELKQRLDDTGLVLFDAATCRFDEIATAEDFRDLVETAAYLNATTINVNGADPDEGRFVDEFAALSAMADEYGIGIGLEFMMSTRVRTLADALRVIERSGAADARITLDSLHLARSGGSASDVAALPGGQLSYVQWCDAPRELPEGGFSKEAVGGRQLPGDGELPLADLAAVIGPTVPIGVEAPSARRVADGVTDDTYAARALDSLERLFGL